MDKTDFFNILQLATTDARVVDDSVIGVGLVVLHRDRSGRLQLQIGSNIPEEAVIEALTESMRHG